MVTMPMKAFTAARTPLESEREGLARAKHKNLATHDQALAVQ
jgi:hypothetical protein